MGAGRLAGASRAFKRKKWRSDSRIAAPCARGSTSPIKACLLQSQSFVVDEAARSGEAAHLSLLRTVRAKFELEGLQAFHDGEDDHVHLLVEYPPKFPVSSARERPQGCFQSLAAPAAPLSALSFPDLKDGACRASWSCRSMSYENPHGAHKSATLQRRSECTRNYERDRHAESASRRCRGGALSRRGGDAVFREPAGIPPGAGQQIHVALHNEVSHGETPAQAEFLLLLANSEKPDQACLARTAGVDTSTTTLVLDNLEVRGLIARESDPDDRRRCVVSLTAAGRKQVGLTRAAFLETQSRLVSPLSQGSVTRFVAGIGADRRRPAKSRATVAGARGPGRGGSLVTRSPGFLCRRGLQVCEAYFIACTASLNLTPRQYSVLFIVKRHPGLSQAAFARIFGLDPATCAVIMKNLATRGLLDRQGLHPGPA